MTENENELNVLESNDEIALGTKTSAAAASKIVSTPIMDNDEDFDWEEGENYSKAEHQRMEKLYESTIHELKENELVQLEPILENPVQSSVFVVFGDKVDKRKKAIKILLEKAVCVEFKKPYENELPQWISHLAKDLGLKISAEAIHRIHRLVGNNLSELDNQLRKIQLYLGERSNIELADVNAVVSFSREENIFDFTKAIGQKDRVKALEQLVSLLDQGQNETGIVHLLSRHVRMLLAVRAGMDQGIGGAKLASLVQVPSYFIESYCDQARSWSLRKLEDTLMILQDTDKALKSSPVSSHIWLENMVLKSCSL